MQHPSREGIAKRYGARVGGLGHDRTTGSSHPFRGNDTGDGLRAKGITKCRKAPRWFAMPFVGLLADPKAG
ncbi:hypothetical protein AKJ09_02832 [Labilithrix luteola]|uniref:Uncharacterized protein n=1 Tax=Labilithrix luteola TaxID=1391654 RepID=A0A0K1PRL3_9BACT|nr:hypothetical protein AKJ09_02832 [Labilithrix luteola]